MTSAEYQQLIDFLGRQFTGIDRRFAEMDGHLTELRREMLGHFDEVYRDSSGSSRSATSSASGTRAPVAPAAA